MLKKTSKHLIINTTGKVIIIYYINYFHNKNNTEEHDLGRKVSI
jgi:hypothetical protein